MANPRFSTAPEFSRPLNSDRSLRPALPPLLIQSFRGTKGRKILAAIVPRLVGGPVWRSGWAGILVANLRLSEILTSLDSHDSWLGRLGFIALSERGKRDSVWLSAISQLDHRTVVANEDEEWSVCDLQPVEKPSQNKRKRERSLINRWVSNTIDGSVDE